MISMIVFPLFDTVVLPDTYLVLTPNEYTEYINEPPKKDDTVIFVILKSYRSKSELSHDNFYPIGIRSKFERIHDDLLIFKTEDRLEIRDIVIKNDRICTSIKSLPDKDDVDNNDYIVYGHYADNIDRYSSVFNDDPKIRLAFKINNSLPGKLSAISPLTTLTVDEKYMLLAEHDSKLRLNMVISYIEDFIIEHYIFSDDLRIEDRIYTKNFLDTPRGHEAMENFLERFYFSRYYFNITQLSNKIYKEFGETSDEYIISKGINESYRSPTLKEIADLCGISKDRCIIGMINLVEFCKSHPEKRKHLLL